MKSHAAQTRRDDLQGIRGLAIISVLLFHFFPAFFPNGYVGVDEFFVLSGFLMTMIFGSKDINIQTTGTFYWRRIRRIVPLYLFVILLVFVLMFPFFPNTFYPINITGAMNACLFYTNMAPKNSEHEYFKQLFEANDLFTHTWSLAVEMQFYLFVPFIFIISKMWISFGKKMFIHLLIMTSSITFYLVADENTSFNNVFCRVWQFEVGILAFVISEHLNQSFLRAAAIEKGELWQGQNNDESQIDPTVHQTHQIATYFFKEDFVFAISSFSVFVFSFFPFKLPENCIRIFTTVFTGVIIVFGTSLEQNPLKNRYLVHIGNISYALYLIHWPIYVWIHFNFPQIWVCCCGIFAAVAFAHVIYTTYEKWYLSLEKFGIALLLIILWASIFVAISKADEIGQLVDGYHQESENTTYIGKTFTPEQVIEINKKFDAAETHNMYLRNCNPHKDKHGFCVFNETRYHGGFDISMVDNSFIPNQGDLIFDSFQKFARNMTKFSKTSCEVLVLSFKSCTNSYNDFLKYVQDVKPDVLFIMTRHFTMDSAISNAIFSNDVLLEKAWSTLKKYEEFVKRKIFILNTIPVVPDKYMQQLNRMIAENVGNVTGRNPMNARLRLNELQKRCRKCQLFDYDEYLTDSHGNPQVFDPKTKISFLSTGNHLTAAGKEVVRPVFQKLTKSFEKDYSKWGFKL